MKDYPEYKCDYPKFYFPSRRGMPSDLGFIKGKLARLGDENRKIACEAYEKIYLHNYNKGEYRKAREEANKWLSDFVEEYGITKKEHSEIVASDASKKRVLELIERCKAAKPKASRILDYADRKKAFKKSAL